MDERATVAFAGVGVDVKGNVYWDLIWGMLKNLLPDIEDEKAVRAFLTTNLGYLQALAVLTGTTLDDAGLDCLQAILASDKAWARLYEAIHYWLCQTDHNPPAPGPVFGSPKTDAADAQRIMGAATEIAGIVGFPVVLILTIISTIITIISFLWNRPVPPVPVPPNPGPQF